MKPRPRNIRLFISSTFVDLEKEREYLARKVFPEIRHLCKERGLGFTEIDLRWGLTSEDAARGRVITTCLEEIDRCRPFFIAILGTRYGWVPEFHEIQKDVALLEKYPWVEGAALDGASLLDLEISHALLDDTHSMPYGFVYAYRGKQLSEDHEKLKLLRDRIERKGYPIREFTKPKELGEMVRQNLAQAIEQFAPTMAPQGELDQERQAHEAFAALRRQAYIANVASVQKLSRFVDSTVPALIVRGESGIGKSSLLAYWSSLYGARHPDVHIISHYVGATAEASDVVTILKRLYLEINDLLGQTESLPASEEELIEKLPIWLAKLQEKRVVIILDALNQLTGKRTDLHWLPQYLPPNVRLIISTTPGPAYDSVKERAWDALELSYLTEEETVALTTRYLADYGKALSHEQMQTLATTSATRSPLYIRTLLEELRLSGSFDRLDRAMRKLLKAKSIDALLQQVLERMEKDFGHETLAEIMSLLWASRAGLTEPELLALTGIERTKLSLILIALEFHLSRRDGKVTFFHDYLRRAVEARYLVDPSVAIAIRLRLAQYFKSQPKGERPFEEVPWQLESLGEETALAEWLSNIDNFLYYCTDANRLQYLRFWVPLRETIQIGEMHYAQLLRMKALKAKAGEYVNASLAIARFLIDAGEYHYSGLIVHEALGHPSAEGRIITELKLLLAKILQHESKLEEAERVLRECITADNELAPSLAVNVHMELGAVLYALNRIPDAEASLQTAYDIVNASGSELAHFIPGILKDLGVMAFMRGNIQGAEDLLKEALKKAEAQFGPLHPECTSTRTNLAAVVRARGDFDEARHYAEAALVANRKLFGPYHRESLASQKGYVIVLRLCGDLEEALRSCLDLIDKSRRSVGNMHPLFASFLIVLATIQIKLGQTSKAELTLAEAIAILSSQLGPDHPRTIEAELTAAKLFGESGRDDQALAILHRRHRFYLDNDQLSREEKEFGIAQYLNLLERNGRVDEVHDLKSKLAKL